MRNTTTYSTIALLITLLFALSSCFMGLAGEGDVIVEEIDLDLIDAIEVDCSADVVIHYGPNQRVEVHGQQNLIDLLSRKVSGDTWVIDFTESVNYSKKFEIHITLPLITSVEIDGSGDVSTATPMKGKELELEINGSGDVTMEVNVNRLSTEIDGSGDVELSGRAKTHTIKINGSGNVDARDLETVDAYISSNGSGNVKVSVSGELDAECGGSGDVNYYGDPEELKIRKTGSGSVEKG